jgi:hypothetical protein
LRQSRKYSKARRRANRRRSCQGQYGVTTLRSVEPPTSPHSDYCSEPKQYYWKKLSTKVCVQQRRHHHTSTKLRKKTYWNQIGLKEVTNLQKYQDETRNWRDSKVKKRDFDVGNLVLLRSPPTESFGKPESKWEGPYAIIDKTRPVAYRLADPQGSKPEHSWNADNLRRFYI